MSGPRHLWSGDWERESAESERSHPEPPPVTETTPEEELSEATSDRRRRLRTLAIITGATIVLVVVAVVLADTLSGSGNHRPKPVASVPHRSPTPQQPNNGGSALPPQTQTVPTTPTPAVPRTQTAPPTTPTTPGPNGFPQTTVPPGPSSVANRPHVNWLGMQIITSPNGAVVNTIQTGSVADVVGFEPGDVIVNVAGTAISVAKDIKPATASVQIGALVPVELTRGSTLIRLAVKMQGRPAVSP